MVVITLPPVPPGTWYKSFPGGFGRAAADLDLSPRQPFGGLLIHPYASGGGQVS